VGIATPGLSTAGVATATLDDKFEPYIVTIEPRAATGMLEELLPVAALTKLETDGAWACRLPQPARIKTIILAINLCGRLRRRPMPS
jgi:hypothetical protein